MTDNHPSDTPIGSDPTENDWIQLARDAFRNSTDFFDANIRKQLEKNLAMFRSKHPSGSRYYTEAYRYRSKMFRPKTRSAIRRAEAAVAVSFFSTADVMSVLPRNPGDETQRASAAVYNEVINARLSGSIPWFATLLGAFVDCATSGVCISKQYWAFAEKEVKRKAKMEDAFGHLMSNPDGSPMLEEVTEYERILDKPKIDLIPVENFRFAVGSDWRDPIGTSPYLVYMTPMFIGDVIEKMHRGKWTEYTEGELRSAHRTGVDDSVRRAREGARTDSTDIDHSNNAFDLVWIHENILRKDGVDYVYWTVGTELLLTDPKPLEEVYHHGVRPFAMGFIEIEPHKAYPSALTELGEGLQIEANEVVNQRMDNVRLVLNQRYKMRDGARVDVQQLKRSIPGGIVRVESMDDVQPLATPDVTSAAYHEQDRINADFDDLLGTFSTASISTARNLNETVGGMNMLEGAANAMTELSIRVFAESWVEPVMRQLLLLEQAYEDDDTLFAIAGEKAQLATKFGIDELNDALLSAELTTQVNVGFGATNPQQRVERLSYGLATAANFMPHLLAKLNHEEVLTEIFGALGHKDGSRFFNLSGEEGPSKEELEATVEELQAQLEQLSQIADGKRAEMEAKLQAEQFRAQSRMQELQYKAVADKELEHIRGQYRIEIEGLKSEIQAVDRMIQSKYLQIDRGKLELQKAALEAQLQRAEKELTQRMDGPQPAAAPKESAPASNPVNRFPSPTAGALKQTLHNDRYGMIPDAKG